MRMTKHGFTLIELSIVLCIIALLIGGTLTGKEILHNSKLQSIMSDIVKYQSAVKTFKDKYYALPGDFPGATAIWGANTSCPWINNSDPASVATCNGNGDGGINAGGSEQYEMYLAWQHLSDAGLIDGAFTGAVGSSINDSVPGRNVPATALIGGGYNLRSLGAQNSATYFDSYYGLTLNIGNYHKDNQVDLPIFSAVEAKMIDTKLDDGLPGQGIVHAYKNAFTPGCTTGDDASTSAYTTSSQVVCALMYSIQLN